MITTSLAHSIERTQKVLSSKIFPKRVKNFHFVKVLNKKRESPYNLGLYANSKGKKAVAKIWIGKKRDLHYFALLHEINVLRTLFQVRKRSLKKTPLTMQLVSTPDFICSVKEKNRQILLTEYFKGKPLIKTPNIEKLTRTHQLCVEYLRFLGKRCTEKERSIISRRSPKDFILIYFLVLSMAILKRPYLTKDLLKGFLVFVSGIPALSFYHSEVLVHGDLHLENIIVSGKKVKIFDMEQSVFTFPQYEYITTLMCKNNPELFSQKIFGSLLKDYKQKKLIRTLLIKCATHYLTGNLSTTKVLLYRKMLQLGIESKKIEKKFFEGLSRPIFN